MALIRVFFCGLISLLASVASAQSLNSNVVQEAAIRPNMHPFISGPLGPRSPQLEIPRRQTLDPEQEKEMAKLIAEVHAKFERLKSNVASGTLNDHTNGAVALYVREKLKSELGEYDRDLDGKITLKERAAVWKARADERRAQELKHLSASFEQIHGINEFAKYDKDGNGVFSNVELVAVKSDFPEFIRNRRHRQTLQN